MDALQKQFASQPQVFIGLPKMSTEQKAQLVANLKLIDLNLVDQMTSVIKSDASKGNDTSQKVPKIEPFMNMVDAEKTDSSTRESWTKAGKQLIFQGKVAALLMAGGQGTRLGSDLPKGQYDIGLPSHKSMFQLQAERLITLAQKVCKTDGKPAPTVPWYIMTSPATHKPTVDFFEKNKYFGYPKAEVFFFEQATIPCLTTEGKLMMESFTQPARSPNGNGGIYAALNTTGALADMKKRKASHVFIYSVDNVLVQVADPEFVGYCAVNGVDFGNKVLEKTDPTESVGVLAVKDGTAAVIEYSELPKDLAEQRNSDKTLVYCAANIAIHCLTTQFIEYSIKMDIPYHVAHKKIPTVNENGDLVKPSKNNGVKLEKFIFDALSLTKKPCAFMVKREGNFSAVKNAPGQNLPDSPDTARADVSAYHQSLVKAAGGTVQISSASNGLFEISPLVSYNGEGLGPIVKGKTYIVPHELKV